ncbi:DUF3953 domain-containing protein [Bacillus haikouensis]|nr:DUF3953 domain-containing protein [Bacillus haikouensis]
MIFLLGLTFLVLGLEEYQNERRENGLVFLYLCCLER